MNKEVEKNTINNNKIISLYDFYNSYLVELKNLFKMLRNNDSIKEFVISDEIKRKVFNKEIELLNVSYNANSDVMKIGVEFLFDGKHKLEVDLIKDYDSDEVKYETNDLIALRFIEKFILDNEVILVDYFSMLETFYKKYKHDIVDNVVINNEEFDIFYSERYFFVYLSFRCGMEPIISYFGPVVNNSKSDDILKRININDIKLNPVYEKVIMLNDKKDEIILDTESKSDLELLYEEINKFLKREIVTSNESVISLYDLCEFLKKIDKDLKENLGPAILENGKINIYNMVVTKVAFDRGFFDENFECIRMRLVCNCSERVNFLSKVKKEEVFCLETCKYIDDDAIFVSNSADEEKGINLVKYIEEYFNYLDYLYDTYGDVFFKENVIKFNLQESIFDIMLKFYTLRIGIHNKVGFYIDINLSDGCNCTKPEEDECKKYIESKCDEIIKRIGIDINKLDNFYRSVLDNRNKKYVLKRK